MQWRPWSPPRACHWPYQGEFRHLLPVPEKKPVGNIQDRANPLPGQQIELHGDIRVGPDRRGHHLDADPFGLIAYSIEPFQRIRITGAVKATDRPQRR